MSQPYVGEIRIFAGNFAPYGWAMCDGATIAISDNDTLFSLIGTTYGGDGQNTFQLPDLRGRVPVHRGTTSGRTFVLGEAGGAEAVALTAQQLPQHTHPIAAASSATTTTASGNVIGGWADAPYAGAGAGPATQLGPMLAAAGGGLAHSNLQPYLAVNYIISLYGIFPSQG